MKMNVYWSAPKKLKRMSTVFAVSGAMLTAMMATALSAQSSEAGSKGAEHETSSDTYQTIYLTNLTQQNDANDIQTDLRNMLPHAHVYYVQSQSALTLRGSAEDLQMAQKIVADLDKVKKVYKLTYTIAETDDGKRLDVKHYSMVVGSGGRTTLKLGSKVPIVTGHMEDDKLAASTQVQYVDVGINIEASIDGYADGVRLRSKVEQSSLGDEKPMGTQDPVIRQNVLDGQASLVQGKPLVLGSLDMPGSSHKQEVEVAYELVR